MEKELDDLAGWIDVMRTAQTEKAKAEEVIKQARSKIEDALGEAEVGTVAGLPVVRWTHVTSERFDQKKAKALLGEQASDCMVASESRRFTLVEDA